MRHKQKRHKLGRDKAHRESLLKNLASCLFQHARIKTTLAKAKALRPFAEKLITKAVKANRTGDSIQRQCYFRLIRRSICDETVASTLLKVWGQHFVARRGGYLRIIKLGQRRSDAAPMALVELVGDSWAMAPGATSCLDAATVIKKNKDCFSEPKKEFARLFHEDRLKAACFGPVPAMKFTLERGIRPGEGTLTVQVGSSGLFSDKIDQGLFPVVLYFYCNEGGHEVKVCGHLPQNVYFKEQQIRIEWKPSQENTHFQLCLSCDTDISKQPPVVRLVRENGATVGLGEVNLNT